MTTFTSEDLAAALAKWRHDLHDELCQLRELGIPIPDRAFAICLSAEPSDYLPMGISETVDCIIDQARLEAANDSK